MYKVYKLLKKDDRAFLELQGALKKAMVLKRGR